MELMDRYKAACCYPGVLDEQRVESELRKYLEALGVKREVRRLRAAWSLETEPALASMVDSVLKDFIRHSGYKPLAASAASDARAALAARAALDALDALAARVASDARAASDALAARDASDARAALDALDALAARDASDARAALDASDALAARDASAASAALDALDALAARDASDARAALDASDALAARDASAASAASRRFAEWCIWKPFWWWGWDASWSGIQHLGAIEKRASSVTKWSEPFFEAFCAGAWILCWTKTTLYWVAKPTLHRETVDGRKQMHNESSAALECDLENLYFWHGVLVPAFVVVRPDWITTEHIRNEENAEVKRVMVERMGWQRFVEESEISVIHSDTLKSRFPRLEASVMVDNADPAALDYVDGEETAELLESQLMRDYEDRPLKFVRLRCPSTGRVYVQRVAHDETRVYAAVARSFKLSEEQYKSGKYLRQGDVLMWALDQNDERIAQAHS